MKKKLKEQVDAMQVFQEFCNKSENIPVWTHLTAFGNALSRLDLKIKEIISTESEQERDNKGVTRAKKEMKTEMANRAVAVAAGLQAYSISVDNLNTYFSMDICFSRIMKAKDASAGGMCKLIYDTANELPINEIGPFGISETLLNELDEAMQNYLSYSPRTRNVIVRKTNLTIKCSRLVKEANEIMRKQLLKIGRQFKTIHPYFYNGLIYSARVHSHSVHSKIRITAVRGEDETPVENVLVEILGTDLKGFTNMEGKRTLTRVPEGIRDVMLIKKGSFKKIVLKDLNFQRGKSISRKVEMTVEYDVPDGKDYNAQDELLRTEDVEIAKSS